MTAPLIQEAARIVERRRQEAGYAAYFCAGCRKSVVFREYEICLNCLGTEGATKRKANEVRDS